MSQSGNFFNGAGPVGSAVDTLTGNTGGVVGPDASHNINVVGAGSVSVAGDAATHTLTISVSGALSDSFVTDSGTATPSAGVLNIVGDGADISTSGSGNTVTIHATVPGQFTWVDETSTGPTTMASNTGYIADNSLLVVLTLPAAANVGDLFRITGKGSGGWKMGQQAGQTVYFGTATTTTGASGYLSSTNRRDTVELVCITSNTEFNVLSSIGNVTVF